MTINSHGRGISSMDCEHTIILVYTLTFCNRHNSRRKQTIWWFESSHFVLPSTSRACSTRCKLMIHRCCRHALLLSCSILQTIEYVAAWMSTIKLKMNNNRTNVIPTASDNQYTEICSRLCYAFTFSGINIFLKPSCFSVSTSTHHYLTNLTSMKSASPYSLSFSRISQIKPFLSVSATKKLNVCTDAVPVVLLQILYSSDFITANWISFKLP